MPELPSLPDIYFRVKTILERPDSSVFEVERELTAEPALTGRLLALANAIYFGARGRVRTVGQALAVLGADEVKHLVLTTSVVNAFRGISPALVDMRHFWLTSAYRALAARELARKIGSTEDDAFVAGLLADIGHLAMYLALPRETEDALWLSLTKGYPLHLAERDQLGFHFAEVGAELLARWNLAPELEATVRHHPEPGAAGAATRAAAVIHIASVLANAAARNLPVANRLTRIETAAWKATGFSPETLLRLNERIESALVELAAAILPGFDVLAWRQS